MSNDQLKERTLRRMAELKIPQGSDNPILLTMGAPDLHLLTSIGNDK